MRIFTRTSWIAAGLVLFRGAVLLGLLAYRQGAGEPHESAARIIGTTWLLAAAALLAGSALRDRGERHIVPAVVIPAMGAALMLPLSMHLVASLMFRGTTSGFDDWVMYSAIFVSVAHVVFAILVGLRAAAIAKEQRPLSVSTVYLASVCAAAVPGLLLVVPVAIVAATGIFLLPALHAMERWCAPRHHVPFAIARAA